MPTGTPFAPRTFPKRLAGLCRLPQSKIHRVTFSVVNLDARTRHHIGELAPAQLAVTFILLDAVINIAVIQNVSKIFIDKPLNHRDNIFHRL